MSRTTDAGRPDATYRPRTADGRSTPTALAPTGAHRAASARRPAPAASGVAGLAGVAVLVFVLALMLVTTIEVVVDHPLSGGDPGHTTLGDVLRPER